MAMSRKEAAVHVTGPTKVTLASLKKGLDALDKKVFDAETRVDTHVARMNMQSHAAMLLMKRLEARVARLAKSSKDYTISGELGQKVGKIAGAAVNTPLHPVTGCVVFTETMTSLWEGFKSGFKATELTFKECAARRAQKEAQRAKDLEDELARQQEGPLDVPA